MMLKSSINIITKTSCLSTILGLTELIYYNLLKNILEVKLFKPANIVKDIIINFLIGRDKY